MTYQQPPQTTARPTELFAILGIVGAVIFWPAGIVLSALALSKIKKTGNGGHSLALAGLIVSIVAAIAWITAIIVIIAAVVSAQNGLNDAAEELESNSAAEEAADVSIVLGEYGESEAGVGIRVDSAECGIESFGEDGVFPGKVVADGQYCQIDVTFTNNSDDTLLLSTAYITAFDGDTAYDMSAALDAYAPEGNEGNGGEVPPSGEMTSTLFYEIPLGADLDRLDFATTLTFSEAKFEVIL